MSALPPKADIGTQPPDVRFVPKADIAGRPINVGFTPESGHSAVQERCPLCTNSGHQLTVFTGGEYPYSREENFSTIKWRYRLPMLRGSLLARLLVVSNPLSVPG